jgi:hypothetical protein
MNASCESQVYFVAGKAVELWENNSQPFGWSDDDLDGYAQYGQWELLFNALVLSHALERATTM